MWRDNCFFIMQKILIATTNEGKYSEICEVLNDLPAEFYHLHSGSLARAIKDENFEENGETFEENATLKALHYGEISGMPTIGEDSGIIVDALDGQLGVKTRRWGAGEKASDEEWIEYFMNVMKGEEKRTARFVCCAAFTDPEKFPGEIFLFKGQTEGTITQTLEAPLRKGIPLSSCFRPIGYDKVYSALTEKEKNTISHRGKAFHELKKFLQKNYFT
jgi:XTP/dITP diphosphohydrolase